MLKSEIIAVLVQKRGVSQKQAESTVETVFECMKDALCRGENIEIRGLGAFHVKNYEGYQGRNPKTGQVIPVRPKRGILFRTGKELRDRVNKSPRLSAGQSVTELSAGGKDGHLPDTGVSVFEPSSLEPSSAEPVEASDAMAAPGSTRTA